MSGSLRPARLIIAIAAALLVAYAVIWTQVSSFDVGRSDFTAFYVGGTLLREGHTGDLYSQAVQQPLHSALIAPDREDNLPFVNTPVAAALVLPATFLPSGRRVPALVAARACGAHPRRRARCAERRLACGDAADLARRRRRRSACRDGDMDDVRAGAMDAAARARHRARLPIVEARVTWQRVRRVLVVSAGIAKPHLALGLLAFLAGWRERQVIIGALPVSRDSRLASLALVGPAGVAGFVSILASSTTRWELATMVSFIGVVGSVFGNGLSAHLVGLVASLLACAAAVWLGMRVRRDPSRLDTALVGAVVLSLVASPHAYPDDLVMLAPAFVIGRRGGARAGWVRPLP